MKTSTRKVPIFWLARDFGIPLGPFFIFLNLLFPKLFSTHIPLQQPKKEEIAMRNVIIALVLFLLWIPVIALAQVAPAGPTGPMAPTGQVAPAGPAGPRSY